jgi:5-(carboxyamino)imidazole ribonucleotide synthase
VGSRIEARSAYAGFRGAACVLEQQLDLACEVSVLIARTRSGEVCVWPVAENVHRSGILFSSTIPAQIGASLAAQARQATVEIATALDYVGVLCVEFFVLGDGSLCVNEMAPRPHNSGHWTLDASLTSQFEQQARVLAGLPLGDTRALAPAVLMLNLLGDLWFASSASAEARAIEPDWSGALAEPSAKLHLYGKTMPRPGRKMGHLTVVADDLNAAQAAARRAARALGLLDWH